MARIKHGINGPLVGKLGNHVGYIRRGEAVLRMKGTPSAKPKTLKQKAAFDRMRVVMKFISPLNDFINVSFKPETLGTTRIPQNAAVSHNIKTAVVGIYPELKMDYSKAVLSKGDLCVADNPQVSFTMNGTVVDVTFMWDVDPAWSYDTRRQQVMMVAYLPDTQKAFALSSGARRSEGQDVLQAVICLTDQRGGKIDRSIETYICFISDDRTQVSDSMYIRRIELP